MDDRSDLIAHYSAADERARLADLGPLEFLRTRILLERVLPDPPGSVLDVGGGPGAYAAWLAERGHAVHLVDPVPLHVEQAAEIGTFTTAVGDAVALDAPDDSYDAVLLFGPIYHLLDRADRLRALREARRVARPGALVAVAAISRYASVMDGFFRGFVADPAFVDILAEDLRSGQHRNPGGHPRYFTSTHFHTVAELRSEVTEAGLAGVEILPVEGALSWAPDLPEVLADPARRDLLLDCLARMETDPAVTAASAHLLALARA